MYSKCRKHNHKSYFIWAILTMVVTYVISRQSHTFLWITVLVTANYTRQSYIYCLYDVIVALWLAQYDILCSSVSWYIQNIEIFPSTTHNHGIKVDYLMGDSNDRHQFRWLNVMIHSTITLSYSISPYQTNDLMHYTQKCFLDFIFGIFSRVN